MAGSPPESKPELGPEPTWRGMFKWAAVMLAISLTVGAISIPLLRLFGVEWGD